MMRLKTGHIKPSKGFAGIAILAGLLALVYMLGCFSDRKIDATDSISLVLDWNKFILLAERETEGYRGPVASRAYGYIGLAAYEAALPGLAGDFKSFTTLFPGLTLPVAPPPEQFDVMASLNSCYTTIMGKFYLTSSEKAKQELARISQGWDFILSQKLDTGIIQASKQYGNLVADAIYSWSATDSLGFMANHHNYDRDFVPPVGEGKWVTSPDFPMPALLPYWGDVRPFVIKTDNFLARPIPPYSGRTNQPYYVQALEIISLSKPISAENQWIADFWNDDHPGLTFSPPGHWMAIANQVVEKEHPSLEKTMETYLRMGFCLADAMIATWHSKYIYYFERPETFIQKFIDPTWRPISPSPSFPSYPLGHAAMGAAAAEVLTALYGDDYKMKDESHKGLPEFAIKPREFNSFFDMARENALSRIILGVHWRRDAEEGMRIGSLIGKEILQVEIEHKLTE